MSVKVTIGILLLGLTTGACTSQSGALAPQLHDTVYVTTTQELKSNTIPDSVFRMVALKHLEVRGMDCDYGPVRDCWEISELPRSVKNLRALKTLRLPVNSLTRLPAELAALPELRVLDLSDGAALRDISVLAKLRGLEELYLYGCGLQHLPDGLTQLTRLRKLGLTGNRLSRSEIDAIKKALPNCVVVYE